jgi:hypothetical protein
MERNSYHGNSISSWVMQGQAYMLAGAAAENGRSGCVLCHVGSGPRV